MNRNGILRSHESVHARQFLAVGMTGNMDKPFIFRDGLDSKMCQAVDEIEDCPLVARDDLRGKDDVVTGLQRHRLMIACGDP